jgi:hypothetical protein
VPVTHANVDPQFHLPHRSSAGISPLPYPSRLAHMQIPFDIPFSPFGKFQKLAPIPKSSVAENLFPNNQGLHPVFRFYEAIGKLKYAVILQLRPGDKVNTALADILDNPSKFRLLWR